MQILSDTITITKQRRMSLILSREGFLTATLSDRASLQDVRAVEGMKCQDSLTYIWCGLVALLLFLRLIHGDEKKTGCSAKLR